MDALYQLCTIFHLAIGIIFLLEDVRLPTLSLDGVATWVSEIERSLLVRLKLKQMIYTVR